MTTPVPPKPPTTTAFAVQAALSFAIALGALLIGLLWIEVDPWVRAFLALGCLYLVTSAFTLAKVVRDQREENDLVHRLDEARVDRLLKEHDPFTSM